MSVNLALYPLQRGWEFGGAGSLPSDHLMIWNPGQLFQKWERDPMSGTWRSPIQRPLPLDQVLWHMTEMGLVRTLTDHRGRPLTWVTAGELKSEIGPPRSGSTGWIEAVRGFVQNLPDDTPIVLYWY